MQWHQARQSSKRLREFGLLLKVARLRAPKIQTGWTGWMWINGCVPTNWTIMGYSGLPRITWLPTPTCRRELWYSATSAKEARYSPIN